MIFRIEPVPQPQIDKLGGLLGQGHASVGCVEGIDGHDVNHRVRAEGFASDSNHAVLIGYTIKDNG